MERKPSDESLRQIEHVSTATKKSVLRFTYRETPTLSSMSSHRSESQRSQGSRRQQCQSGGRDTKSTALVRPLRYKICTYLKVRFERFMIHACSFQGGKLSRCPFKTMNYDTSKKKGKVEDKWHRGLGENKSFQVLFVLSRWSAAALASLRQPSCQQAGSQIRQGLSSRQIISC